MAAVEEISRIEGELDEARRDLRETMAQVHQKVEIVETELRPDFRVIKKYPFTSIGVLAALGFLVGTRSQRPILAPAIVGFLIGCGAVSLYSRKGERDNGNAEF
jgi:hypothetical protein